MGRAARDKGLLIVNNFVMYTAIMLRSPGPLIAPPSLPPAFRRSHAETRRRTCAFPRRDRERCYIFAANAPDRMSVRRRRPDPRFSLVTSAYRCDSVRVATLRVQIKCNPRSNFIISIFYLDTAVFSSETWKSSLDPG